MHSPIVPLPVTPLRSARLDRPAAPGLESNVAAEMNLAETAFLHPEGDGFRLRWFTPLVEVDLCGHATLASAHVLWESGRLPAGVPQRASTLPAVC